MYARVASFNLGEGVDQTIDQIRGDVESGNRPPGLEDAKGMMMLVDRSIPSDFPLFEHRNGPQLLGHAFRQHDQRRHERRQGRDGRESPGRAARALRKYGDRARGDLYVDQVRTSSRRQGKGRLRAALSFSGTMSP